jgi:hypothetical protein
MASSIDASTSGAGGVITTADNTGILQLKTAGVVAVTVNASSALGVGTSPSFGTSGQVLTSAGSSAAPTWATPASGGMTLLGTVNTTSGTSQTLSGLTLTGYKKLEFAILGVKSTATSFKLQLNDGTSSYNLMYTNTYDVAEGFTGVVTLYLVNGVFGSTVTSSAPSGTYGSSVDYCASGGTRYTTASTSVIFVANTGNFNGGSIKVYGVS